MPIFKRGDTKIFFSHIPKTGGTYITSSFIDSGFEVCLTDCKIFDSSTIDNSLKECITLKTSPQHIHRDQVRMIIQRENINANFTVVRHPVDRLVSEFNFRMSAKYKGHVYPGEGSASVVFDEWVDQIFAKYQNNNYILDNHIRPQNEFILHDTIIYKLEHGYEDICKQLRDGIAGEFFYGLKHKIFKTPHKYITKNELSDTTLEKILLFYEQDFKILEYNYK